MRATIQSDMFLYDQLGQNVDIRGVIRYGPPPFSRNVDYLHVSFRYSDGAQTGLPGDHASADPGPGVPGLADVDGKTTLAPLEPAPALNATRATAVTVSFQNTPDGQFLAFMNDTSWEPLNGTTTLLAVHQNPTGFAPDVAGIGSGDQLLLTADSIQVIDLQVVRALFCFFYVSCSLTHAEQNNLDDGDHPFHLHGHRPWMYVLD